MEEVDGLASLLERGASAGWGVLSAEVARHGVPVGGVEPRDRARITARIVVAVDGLPELLEATGGIVGLLLDGGRDRQHLCRCVLRARCQVTFDRAHHRPMLLLDSRQQRPDEVEPSPRRLSGGLELWGVDGVGVEERRVKHHGGLPQVGLS